MEKKGIYSDAMTVGTATNDRFYSKGVVREATLLSTGSKIKCNIPYNRAGVTSKIRLIDLFLCFQQCI